MTKVQGTEFFGHWSLVIGTLQFSWRGAEESWRIGSESVTIVACRVFSSDWTQDRARGWHLVRVGIGHDTHRLVEGRPLILGGVRVDYRLGLLGHSDADVVMHAVADALLGAAGLGDIGELYPDTDPRWEGLDGRVLLGEVVDRVNAEGWRPLNCDVILHAQAPRITPFKAEIRANLAALLGLLAAEVNVKAKTGEHVGPIGRGEAISCEAVVLLKAVGPDSLESRQVKSSH